MHPLPTQSTARDKRQLEPNRQGPSFQTLFSGANADSGKDKREATYRKCSVCGSARACRHRRAMNGHRSSREKRRSISDTHSNGGGVSYEESRVLRQANWDIANVVEPLIGAKQSVRLKENVPMGRNDFAREDVSSRGKAVVAEESVDHYSSDSFEEAELSPEVQSRDAVVNVEPLSLSANHSKESVVDSGLSLPKIEEKDRLRHLGESSTAREGSISLPIITTKNGAISARGTQGERAERTASVESCVSNEAQAALPSLQVENRDLGRIGREDYFPIQQNELPPSQIENILELGYVEPSPRSAQEQPSVYALQERGNVSFKTPVLPRGRVLKFFIFSTWGDPHYVGLNGIDLFDENGQKIVVSPSNISADPPDINVLPGYGSDPRTIDKLVDDCQYTCDDLHMWLAPFNLKEEQTITIELRSTETISMIRVWNYNKNRIHSFRGVRLLRLTLDSVEVFNGEIKKAPGAMFAMECCCEAILFTKNDKVVAAIERQNPRWSHNNNVNQDEANGLVQERLEEIRSLRPNTAKGDESQEHTQKHEHSACAPLKASSCTDPTPTLPFVSPILTAKDEHSEVPMADRPVCDESECGDPGFSPMTFAAPRKARRFHMNFTATWGGQFYLGLTGLCLLVQKVEGGAVEEYYPRLDSVRATPADINIMGHSGDPRTLDKLFNKVNVTTEDTDMWLIPFTNEANHTIDIELPEDIGMVVGFRVWNYNKSEEDTRRGAKIAHVEINEERVSPGHGFMLRKAIGTDDFDCGQTVLFDGRDAAAPCETPRIYTTIPGQDWEVPILPRGFVVRLDLSDTHGDQFYLGLNGLEIFDERGQHVPISPTQVHAVPHSVNVLDNSPGTDVRVPSNLVNGLNQSDSSSCAWLAPLASSLDPLEVNKVYIVLDKPVTIGAVRLWNYSANPTRGASEVTMWLDGFMLYKGGLRQYSKETPYHTIVFHPSQSQDSSTLREASYCGNRVQEVLMINDLQVVQDTRSTKKVVSRPLDLGARPQTAATLEYVSQAPSVRFA